MIAMVGLGNPGEKYQNNRHNAGQMFTDYLLVTLRVTTHENYKFTFDKHCNSQLAKLIIKNKELLLIKPQTFMNRSGEAVFKLISNFKFQISNLVVAHDDLDIPLGKFKIQKGTGPQLHNGLESIEQHLKTKDFWRVRIGVDNRTNNPERSASWRRVEGETYVLNDFLPAEKNSLMKEIFPKIFNRLKSTAMI